MSPIRKDKNRLAQIICQAQAEIREEVQALLEKLRDQEVGRSRYERREGWFYQYGYSFRKVVETRWGSLSGVRIPRLGGPSEEVRLFGRYERRLTVLAEQLVMGGGRG